MYQIEIKDENDEIIAYLACTDEEKPHTDFKDLDRIRKECGADIFTLDAFCEAIENDMFNRHDGIGYFHNGEKETDISVWNNDLSYDDVRNYPYVCWYNK